MQRPRGTRDLFGEELRNIRHVTRVMTDVFRRYGYSEIETPMFEHLELFTKKSGANVVNQLYAFQDKSGRWLALRPELTAPAVRAYLSHLKSAPKPLKLFYLGDCFRYEEPQAGRWRQFLQSGVEIIGSTRTEADAEVIALSDDIMRELGLKWRKLHIGNIRLLREVLSKAGVKDDDQDSIMRAIDSHEDPRLNDELERAGLEGHDGDLIRTLIKLRGDVKVLDQAEKIISDLPRAKVAVNKLRDILKQVKLMGVNNFSVDFGIARGLEYYTDTVFEFYVDDVQVAGGGRYDELIELLGGEPCQAVGVGIGVDRIAQILLKRKIKVTSERLDCMVLPASEAILDECLRVARELRAAGLVVDVDLMGRSLTKAISYANSRKAERVVIIGAKDLAAGEVTVRDMRTGVQEQIQKGELIEKLRKH
jgi:histidyl-tRNA synthetase